VRSIKLAFIGWNVAYDTFTNLETPTANPQPARIFVTGDDFGVSAAVNQAIEAYHRAGALHQASLMVAEKHVEDAAAIARRNPGLRVGLHLTLCDGHATEPSALTDIRGRFTNSPAIAGMRYAFDPRLREPLRAEIRRQFERFIALGFPPTYWDGHTHLHLHPLIIRLTLPIAQEFGFKFTRLVREPGPFELIPWIFDRLSAATIPKLKKAEIGFADRVFGLRNTGRMTEAVFREAIRKAKGLTEIYIHPGAEAACPSPEWLAHLLSDAGGQV
jgi:hopanoid biosynthesis associated protein HpnK